jgi:hypothetical protein
MHRPDPDQPLGMMRRWIATDISAKICCVAEGSLADASLSDTIPSVVDHQRGVNEKAVRDGQQ